MKFKYLFSFSLTVFLITIAGIVAVAYDSLIDSSQTVYTKVNIEEVLANYEIENVEAFRNYPTEFLKYYNAVIKNKSLDKESQGFYLNFFEYFIDYIDYINLEAVAETIATFKLLLPSDIDEKVKKEAIENNVAAKTIYDNGLRIEIYSYNDEEDYRRILTHESFHLFSNFGNWSLIGDVFLKDNIFYAYDYLNPPLNMKREELHRNVGWTFLEAATELLTNEYSYSNSYKVYENEVLALKILIEIIGEDILIEAFNHQNGIVDILNEISKINDKPDELLDVVEQIDKITINLKDNNIINYYQYYEYLATLALIKYDVNSLSELPIEIRAYFDIFKMYLIKSNIEDRLEELKNVIQTQDFYLYIIDSNYLLNMSIDELKNIKLESIIINKKYYKVSSEDQFNVTITYKDSKTLEVITKIYDIKQKANDLFAFYISRIEALFLKGFLLSILSVNKIPFKWSISC